MVCILKYCIKKTRDICFSTQDDMQQDDICSELITTHHLYVRCVDFSVVLLYISSMYVFFCDDHKPFYLSVTPF